MMGLSTLQRYILLLGLLLIVLSLLFPCWEKLLPGGGGSQYVSEYEHYRFVFTPPEEYGPHMTIDLPRLIVQIAVIILTTIGFIIFASTRKNPKRSTEITRQVSNRSPSADDEVSTTDSAPIKKKARLTNALLNISIGFAMMAVFYGFLFSYSLLWETVIVMREKLKTSPVQIVIVCTLIVWLFRWGRSKWVTGRRRDQADKH